MELVLGNVAPVSPFFLPFSLLPSLPPPRTPTRPPSRGRRAAASG